MRSTLTKVRSMFRATADQPSPAAARQEAEHETAGEVEVALPGDARAGESPYRHGGPAHEPHLTRRTNA